jgi:hypothetical protein
MALFFSKPDVRALKEAGNTKGLLRALGYKGDYYVRQSAAEALTDLGCREAIPAIWNLFVNDEDSHVRYWAAEYLGRFDYLPDDPEQAVKLLAALRRYDDCVVFGSVAIVPMLGKFAGIGDGWDAHKRYREAYLKLGDEGLAVFCLYTDQLYGEYKTMCAQTTSINYSFDADKQKAAVIEAYAKTLGFAATLIGAFARPLALSYLESLYPRVRADIYSDSDGGFNDMFKAVLVRRKIISAPEAFGPDYYEAVVPLLVEGLGDPSRFVRWEAVDLIEKWPRTAVTDVQLRGALQQALDIEEDSVSSRRRVMEAILEGRDVAPR